MYKSLRMIGCFILWAAFGFVSCWATASSLQLNLPSWEPIMVWVVTIGFYVAASFGTSWFIESFKPFCPNHRLKFWGGLSLIVLFWLFFSMPTNTHKLFYDQEIAKTVSDDISTSRDYLMQIRSNALSSTVLDDDIKKVSDRVNNLLRDLKTELVDNYMKPGQGPRTKKILNSIGEVLNTPSVEINADPKNPHERFALYQLYENKIGEQLKIYTEGLKQKYAAKTQKDNCVQIAAQADSLNNILQDIQKQIDEGKIKVTDYEQMNPSSGKGVSQYLSDAYTFINNNNSFVTFKNNIDKELYVKSNKRAAVTNTNQLFSVYTVWGNFLSGVYGMTFIWMLLAAILIDIAGFLFFTIGYSLLKKNINIQ